MVDIRYWGAQFASEVRRRGKVGGTTTFGRQFWAGLLPKFERFGPQGRSIYTEDWDVLLILDACRVDLMDEVKADYDFLPSCIPSFPSLAGYSKEWLVRNFTGEQLSQHRDDIESTAYITGNPFTDTVFSDDHPFITLDEVWKYGWDDTEGTIHPEIISDRAIQTWRESDTERMIVHYMQPHIPFVGEIRGDWHEGFDPNAGSWGTEEQPKDLWERYRDGDLDASKAELWAAYKSNLKYVLNHLEDVLLSNIDAETVVISADHGNAFGEGGYYGHGNVPLKSVKHVPWIRTAAEDKDTYTPTEYDSTQQVNHEAVTNRLRALGYHE
ncbi:hypothetical protein ACFQH3_01290 [Haladaptatus sp. GCM10025707]|uniref:hypothetical protein n=1 Tax=unclassified Haladaptatus TaxID=2622732 RepID=UPI0023E882B5|nr:MULTISPECIES: hypothetical protein [unclassified Haladaptatus]